MIECSPLISIYMLLHSWYIVLLYILNLLLYAIYDLSIVCCGRQLPPQSLSVESAGGHPAVLDPQHVLVDAARDFPTPPCW